MMSHNILGKFDYCRELRTVRSAIFVRLLNEEIEFRLYCARFCILIV